MIVRIWHGATPESKADAYVDYLKKTGVKNYRATAGNKGVYLLRRIASGKADFLLVTLWESHDAIRRFAGPEPEKAVYYPEDDEYLLEKPEKLVHYEVVHSMKPE